MACVSSKSLCINSTLLNTSDFLLKTPYTVNTEDKVDFRLSEYGL